MKTSPESKKEDAKGHQGRNTQRQNKNEAHGYGVPQARINTQKRIFPKLQVGSANDPAEREADLAAEQVMRGGKVHTEGARSVTTGQGNDQPGALRMKANSAAQGGMNAPASVESGIQSKRGKGGSLPQPIQQKLSHTFGTDFSGVRVHNDSTSQDMNAQLRAKAFTQGSDMFFGKGQYAPGTAEGDRLIAHEAAHVVQGGEVGPIRRKEGGADSQPPLRVRGKQLVINSPDLSKKFYAAAMQQDFAHLNELMKYISENDYFYDDYYAQLAKEFGEDSDGSVFRTGNSYWFHLEIWGREGFYGTKPDGSPELLGLGGYFLIGGFNYIPAEKEDDSWWTWFRNLFGEGDGGSQRGGVHYTGGKGGSKYKMTQGVPEIKDIETLLQFVGATKQMGPGPVGLVPELFNTFNNLTQEIDEKSGGKLKGNSISKDPKPAPAEMNTTQNANMMDIDGNLFDRNKTYTFTLNDGSEVRCTPGALQIQHLEPTGRKIKSWK